MGPAFFVSDVRGIRGRETWFFPVKNIMAMQHFKALPRLNNESPGG